MSSLKQVVGQVLYGNQECNTELWTLYRHPLQTPPHIHFTVVSPPHEVPVGLYLVLYPYLKQIAMFSYCYVVVFAKTASVRLMSAINMLKQGFTFTPNMRFNSFIHAEQCGEKNVC